MRGRPYVRRGGLAFALGNLAGVLTAGNRLDAALEVAREGLPRLVEVGFAWAYMDHLALHAALTPRWRAKIRTLRSWPATAMRVMR